MALPTAPHVLITDVGSTTTKAILVSRDNGRYRFSGECAVPTTVEKPMEDVTIGVLNAVECLQTMLNVELLDRSGELAVPYCTTSSAGGGLQILVFGLTSTDTGKIAELTAHGAGGVILSTFTIDDRIPAIHKMRLIRDLHPDMILLAGGIEGGDIANVVRLSEILSLARPTPKFEKEGKNTLLFCGNTDARSFVENVFDSNFDIHIAENIRPNLTETNVEPAKRKILELFMENVMERAPGYSMLKQWTTADIIPTPIGVERILRLYGEKHQKNVVMVDMGGATTDIFSNIYGEYSRTVAANIGMSYSIANIVAQAGMDTIMRLLPSPIQEDDARNYIANKMINPTYVPVTGGERSVEEAAAVVGIELSWQQHQDMNFTIAKVGLLDRLKGRVDYDPFQETFHGQNLEMYFHVSDIDLIIGSGGVLSHARSDDAAVLMLAEAFKPTGITKLAIDLSFKSPHLGVLSTLDETVALDLFEHHCLREIAYVVAPTGDMDPKKTVLMVRDQATDEINHMQGNDVLYFPSGGAFEVEAAHGVRIYQSMHEVVFTTKLPVLFDCRGRGKGFSGTPLKAYSIPAFSTTDLSMGTDVLKPHREIEHGEHRFRRELPYEGQIFVKPNDTVEPTTVIGENSFTPPRLYILDVQRLVGYHRQLSPEALREGILVHEGDEVRLGQRIFRGDERFLGLVYYCTSPVRGRVLRVEKNGLIILREIQDYSRKPVVVDIAKPLGIAPKHIRSRLEFDIGDFVQLGQDLVKGSGARLPIKAPRTGTLKSIDTANGTVTLQYDVEPIPLHAFVKGRVVSVEENHTVEIIASGTIVYGVIGFGKETSGPLQLCHSAKSVGSGLSGTIVVSFHPVDAVFLTHCAGVGVRGIIAPSIECSDLATFRGEELGVAVTGDEDIPVAIVITEGFGSIEMDQEYRTVFERGVGLQASLNPRTQIRAGVMRPLVILTG